MSKIKYFLRQNKMLVLIFGIILVCSIAIAVGVYSQVTSTGSSSKKEKQEQEANYENLKNGFKDIFTNSINKQKTANPNFNYDEIIYCRYNIIEEKSGKYSINARVPGFKLDSEEVKKINGEIFDTFARKIIDIMNNALIYTTYNLDYTAYVNGNIISLIIRCNYKDGTNAQRTIIQTYNYDIENDRLLNIQDIIKYKNLDKEEIQKKVNEEIKKVNSQMKNISEQGYNVYVRNENDEIYKIDNTSNFFLGKDNYLYLVYAYGNNNYTSEMDLVIF